MKVAISGLSVKPGTTGGGETVLRHLVRHLPGAGDDLELTVYASRRNRTVFEGLAEGVEVHVAPACPATPAARVAWELLVLPRLLRRHDIDVFLGVNQVLPPGLPCAGVSFLQNELYYRFREFCAPARVGWRQSLRLHARFAYYGAANDRSLRRARRGVAVSEALRRLAAERAGVPAERIDVVPLAPSEDLRPEAGPVPEPPGTGPPTFLMLGAVTPYKNIERAIEAAALLGQRGCDVAVEVVGWDVWGYAARLEAHAASLGVSDRVAFPGPVRHADTADCYRRARALLMLSACEAFPLPLVEAMRCGTPVIAADRSGVGEAAGTGALVVDPDDVEGLAGQMQGLAESDERHARLAAAGADWVSRFSWARTARELADSLRRSLQA